MCINSYNGSHCPSEVYKFVLNKPVRQGHYPRYCHGYVMRCSTSTMKAPFAKSKIHWIAREKLTGGYSRLPLPRPRDQS